MGNSLLILGNGFDLAHNLKSSYENFRSYLIQRAFESRKCDLDFEDELEQIIIEYFDEPKNVDEIKNKYLANLTQGKDKYTTCINDALSNLFRESDTVFNLDTNEYTNHDDLAYDWLVHINKVVDYLYSSKKNLWSDFEGNLRCLELDSVADILKPYDENDADETKYGDEDAFYADFQVLTYTIHWLFQDWANDLNSKIDINPLPEFKKFISDVSPKIITFNYTDTIENIYSYDNIYHIHGHADGYAELVFGTSVENDYDDRYRYSAYDGLIKNTDKWWNNMIDQSPSILNNIENIYVYGHSLGEVDHDYLNRIIDRLPKAVWYINVYDESKYSDMKDILTGLGAKEVNMWHLKV